MCGIFGYIGYRKNASKLVFEGIKNLEYRGYDSWGVAAVFKNRIFIKKRAGKIGNAVIDLPGNISVGHTRWATHGGVTHLNAHPHLDCMSNIAVIHNGIFENYEGFKNKLILKGHKLISQTDTEVIAHMIEDVGGKKSFPQAVRSVFLKMKGLNAVIAVNTKEKSIVVVRNGSPICIGFGKNENFIASDASALIPFTRNIYFLRDNEMAIIKENGVSVLNNYSGKNIKYKTQTVDWKLTHGEKGKYPFYMLKEIYEQPKIIQNIILNSPKDIDRVTELIKRAKGVYLVGCGTASYACLTGEYLFSKIAKEHVNFSVGSEFGYHLDFLNKKSLVIAVSQSGETMDILESINKAKEKKAQIVGLVNVLGSSLYRLSDFNVLIGAGLEKGVASTKAFTGMISHLILMAYALDNRLSEGQKVLTMAVNSLSKVLSNKGVKNITTLAKQIFKSNHIYVIGRGISYPTSLETALKIKEISYIHAEGLAAGELKHGPLALVEKETPCIAFLPNDETYGANLAGAMEMKARGGYVIGISFKPHEVFDYFIPVKDAKEATIIPNVVVGQLLAYYLTIQKGLDPDKPRNLAKSVTVK